MKRLLALWLAALLCLTGTTAALATETPFFQCSSFDASQVDVSGVQEVDGRLVGVVRLPATDRYGNPTALLRVDCPLPADLTEAQRATLHVRRLSISTDQLKSALEAIGQTPANDGFSQYEGGVETVVSYQSERHIDHGYFRQQLCDIAVSHDPAFAASYAQARDVLRRLLATLGAQPAESVFHANRLDAAHSDPYSPTESTTAAQASAQRRAHFEAEEAKAGRTEPCYTMVRGLYQLYGLPVMDQFFYPLDGDWIGASSEFRAAVRDDGALSFVEISGLPQVVSAEPLTLPKLDWRSLLQQAVACLMVTNASPVDEVRDGGTVYARYAVITDLKPCWVGQTADTLVPGWYCVTEERVCHDDSVSAIWAQYGDAQSLMQR